MPQRCFYISGRVQGVWFRESTRSKAIELGLNGIAKNLEDGRVQVMADGPSAALACLEQWLHQGPPLASVNKVCSEASSFEPMQGFTTV